jgi:hypothetical protein
MAAHSYSIGVRNLHIDDLVRASDVIAVAEVTEAKMIGPAQPIQFRGKFLQAATYSNELLLRRVIKGSPADRIIVEYALPTTFVGYRTLQPGTRMVFLRQGQDRYSPADPYYPDFPAVLSTAGNESSGPAVGGYTTAVVREMIAVIASASASSAEKSQVLRVDYALPANAEVVAAFREGVANAQDQDLQQRLQGELIRLGDMTELPHIAGLLLSNTATADQRIWLLYVIGNRVSDRQAIPALKPLLRSGESSLRAAAVEALWHIADPIAVPELAKSLQDTDEQVRFYAVRALSDIANEPGWGGPGESEFREHQDKYLTHWQNWAKGRAQ